MAEHDLSTLTDWGACAFALCVATRWLPAARAAWPPAAAGEYALEQVWHWLVNGGDRPLLDRSSLENLLPLDASGLLDNVPGAGATLSVVRPLIEVAALLQGANTAADAASGAEIEGTSSADRLGWIEVACAPNAGLEEVRRHLEAWSRAPSVIEERRSQDADLALIEAGVEGPALARNLRFINEGRGEEICARARRLGWV